MILLLRLRKFHKLNSTKSDFAKNKGVLSSVINKFSTFIPSLELKVTEFASIRYEFPSNQMITDHLKKV